MESRRLELLELKAYTDSVEKEFTMMLQSLQWDRHSLLQKPALVSCKYDSNHKMPAARAAEHEKRCFISHHGYSKDELLLPDPLYQDSSTLVRLNKEDITKILQNASTMDASFKRGVSSPGPEPLSLERLQRTYTADERRAIHDAVVSAVPSCHDLADLALTSAEQGEKNTKVVSRAEILAELRNMRRRRTKYRVAAKSRNYSDVLRDVIKTQMEHYNEAKHGPEVNQTQDINTNDKQTDAIHQRYPKEYKSSDRYNNDERKNEKHRDRLKETNEIYNKYKGKSRNISDRDHEESLFRERYEKHRDRSRDSRDDGKGSRYNSDKNGRHDSHSNREMKMEGKDNYNKRQHRETRDSNTYRDDSGKRKYKYAYQEKRSSELRVKKEKDSECEDSDLRYNYEKRSNDHKYNRPKESKYERTETHSKRTDRKDRRQSKEKRNREYDNIRVKTERSSRERSYDSYSTQSTSHGDDKYRRYYDLQSQESGKRK